MSSAAGLFYGGDEAFPYQVELFDQVECTIDGAVYHACPVDTQER